MTPVERRRWVSVGQLISTGTLLLLAAGCATAIAQQYQDQSAINLRQAEAVASMSAQIAAMNARIANLESMVNYALLGIVGSVITQLVQLRAVKK